MSCSSRAIRTRSAATACSAWRWSAKLCSARAAACLRPRTNTPASQNAVITPARNQGAPNVCPPNRVRMFTTAGTFGWPAML